MKYLNARKILCALAVVLVLACSSFAAENPDSKARNIYQLFTRVNPKLDAGRVKKYVDIVISAGKKYKQDPYVIAAIIVHESTVNYKALSKGGDYGLMQVRWKVHEKAIKKEYPKIKRANDFFDPKTNIYFGTRILSECAAKSKTLRDALIKYTGGGKKTADKVLKTYNELKAMDKTDGKSKKKSGISGFLDGLSWARAGADCEVIRSTGMNK